MSFLPFSQSSRSPSPSSLRRLLHQLHRPLERPRCPSRVPARLADFGAPPVRLGPRRLQLHSPCGLRPGFPCPSDLQQRRGGVRPRPRVFRVSQRRGFVVVHRDGPGPARESGVAQRAGDLGGGLERDGWGRRRRGGHLFFFFFNSVFLMIFGEEAWRQFFFLLLFFYAFFLFVLFTLSFRYRSFI